MKIKKYKNTPGILTRKPTDNELILAKLGRLRFVDNQGNKYSYLPEGYSVVDWSQKLVDNDKDLEGYMSLPEITILGTPSISERDTDANIAHRQLVAAADNYVHNLGMTQLDRTQMKNLGQLSGVVLGGAALAGGGAAAIPYLLPGTAGGNIIGNMAFGEALNNAIKYGTGKTLGEHAVNAAHYLGIPESQWGDYGIQFIGDTPLYLAGDALAKGIKLGITLTKEALDKAALNKSYSPTTKDLAKAINAEVKNKQFSNLFPGQIGWAPRQTLTGYHASNKPIQEFNYWHPNWAVVEHDSPHGIYFTANETRPSGGFLAKRPYIEQVTSTFDRPMVLVGEISTASKNATRNSIERQAQSMGADGIVYQGIKDNQLENQTIVKTLNPDLEVNVSEIIENDPQKPLDLTLQGFTNNSSTQQNNISELMDRFISQDIIPRLQTLGYQITNYKPNIRELSPETDLVDALMLNRNAGAWFMPSVNDVTIRGSLLDQDYGLLLHEIGGHGLRYNLLSDYRPTTRYYLNQYVAGNGNSPEIAKELLLVRVGTQPYTQVETKALLEGYPYVSTYFQLNPTKDPNKILNESGAVNTLFRAKISLRNGHVIGEDLNKAIDSTQDGVILKMLDDQPYTHHGFINHVLELTGKDPDDLVFLSESDWEQLIKQYPKLTNISKLIKTAMKTVGVTSGLSYGLHQLNQPTSNRKGGKLISRKQYS